MTSQESNALPVLCAFFVIPKTYSPSGMNHFLAFSKVGFGDLCQLLSGDQKLVEMTQFKISHE